MHNAGFAALGLDMAYVPFPVPPDRLDAALELLPDLGVLGLNVTLPHKEAAFRLVRNRSEIAERMGVVNTLVLRDGAWLGTTTDPDGFLEGYRETGRSFTGRSVAVLGNGGSARTIAFALLTLESPARVAVFARRADPSLRLAAEIAAKTGGRLETHDLKTYRALHREFDLVVHTTPAGMQGRETECLVDPDAISPGQTVYDIVYVPEETELLKRARAAGAETVGGLGMLVHQGLRSFEAWTGQRPAAELFYGAARRALEARRRNGATR